MCNASPRISPEGTFISALIASNPPPAEAELQTETRRVDPAEAQRHLRGRSWTEVEQRDCYGIMLSVHASSLDHWDDVLRLLPPAGPMTGGTAGHCSFSFIWSEDGDRHLLVTDDGLMVWSRDAGVLLDVLRAESARQVATRTPHFSVVHAGAVAIEGRGILLPGASGAGKSTLVRSLVALGATYYSDEFALLDEAGQLWPYPCAICITDAAGRETRVRPETMGAQIGTEPVPIALVAFPTYSRGSELRVDDLDRAGAALHLVEDMTSMWDHAQRDLSRAVQATQVARCYTICHGSSDHAAKVVWSMRKGSHHVHG